MALLCRRSEGDVKVLSLNDVKVFRCLEEYWRRGLGSVLMAPSRPIDLKVQEAFKRKKAQEQVEKKLRIAARAEKKKLEQALTEKLDAQIGKERKLPVTKPAATLSAQQLLAKKKSTIGMYFNCGKEPLINLSNSNVQFDPISSDSNSEELASFAISSDVIIVSVDTILPPLSDSSDVIVHDT